MTTVVIAVVPLIAAGLLALYAGRIIAWLDWAILTLRKSRK